MLKRIFGNISGDKYEVSAVSVDGCEEKEVSGEMEGKEKNGSEEEEEAVHDRKYKFETLRDDGLRAMQIGQTEYAVRCLSSALEYKDDNESRLHLAEAYMKLYKGGEALTQLEELLRRDEGNGQLYVMAAEAAEQMSNWELMETYAQKAVDAMPEDDNALYVLARCKYNREEYSETENLLTILIGRNEKYASVCQLRARAFYEQKKYNEALADLEYLITNDRASEDTYLLKGIISQEVHDMQTAKDAYSKILELNPFSMEAVLRLAYIEVEESCPQKALEYLDEAISLQEDFAEAYMLRAKVKRLLQDEQGALEDENTAAHLTPREGMRNEENIEQKMNSYYKNLNPYGF